MTGSRGFYWRSQWHPTPALLTGKSSPPMDGGAWWAAVHGVAKSRTRLSNIAFTFHFHALEKEMATHSSIFAWRIPGAGEPGGLPSMGSHRVGHYWSDLAAGDSTVHPATNILGFHFSYLTRGKYCLKCIYVEYIQLNYNYHSWEQWPWLSQSLWNLQFLVQLPGW